MDKKKRHSQKPVAPLLPASAARPGRWQQLLAVVLIAAASLAIYMRPMSYGYSQHDDDNIVLNNLTYLKDISNIPDAFIVDAWFRVKTIELYRPLQNISFIIDAQLGDDIIRTTHITNLVLHILCCIAVFYLFVLLHFPYRFALAGALLYTVHFLFLHAVIWIPARGDLLLALFSFLSMITFIRAVGSKRWYDYLLNALTFALALLAKETAIVLPVIYLVYLWFFNRDELRRRPNLIIPAAIVVISIVYFALRSRAIISDDKAVGLLSLLLNIRTVPEVIAKFFIPVNFSTLPAFDATATLVGIFMMAILAILLFLTRLIRNRTVLFGLIWFFLFLLPGMVYRPEFSSYTYDYLDHRNYTPAFGFFIVLLAGVLYLRQRLSPSVGRIIMPLLFVVPLGYLATANIVLSPMYTGPLSYSDRAVALNPKCSLGLFIHGNEVYALGQKHRALYDFRQALVYYPKFYDARYNLAVVLSDHKRFGEALEEVNILIDSKPDYGAKAYTLRGIIKRNLNRHEEAGKDFARALEIDPGDAMAAKHQREIDQMMALIPPHIRESRKNNDDGIAAAKRGDIAEAVRCFSMAIEKDPTFYEAMSNLGNCRQMQGDLNEACRLWRKAADNGNKGAADMAARFCK